MTFSPIQNVLGVQPVGTNVTCVNKSGETLVVGDLVITSFIHAGVVVNPEQAANTSYVFNCVRKASASESGNTGYLGVVTKLLTGVGGNGYNVEVQFGGICTARVLVDATVTPGTLLGISGTAGVLSNTVSNSKYSVTLMDDAAVADGTALKRVYIPSEYEKNLGSGGGGTPGGSATQVQFNNGSAFAGDAGLTFNSTTDALTVGGNSTINGVSVGKGNNSISTNTAVGVNALSVVGTSQNCTAIGHQAGFSLNGGYNNTLIGRNAGYLITGGAGNGSGFDNTIVGSNAGGGLGTGHTNTLIGSSAGAVVTSNSNTMVGYGTGPLTTTGAGNVFVGANSGQFNTTGSGNVAVGNESLRGISATQPFKGNASTAVGSNALANVIPSGAGDSNTAVGYQAAQDVRTGNYNVAIGNQALVSNLIGDANTAVGEYSGDGCKQSNNVYVGQLAAYRNWFGTGNVMIGQSAGTGNNSISNQKDEHPNLSPSTVTTGTSPYNASENTVIGFEAFRHPRDTEGASPIIETVTMTQTPGAAIVVTKTTHGLSTGNAVAFRSSTVNPSAAGNANLSLTLLPSPLFSGRTYYAIVIDANTYRLAQSPDETATNGFNVATPILCTAATGSGTYSRVTTGTATANGNTIVGYRAGLAGAGTASQFSGTHNSLFGHQAGLVMTSGSNNVCMGKDAGDLLTTGSNNVCVGYQADPATATTSNTVTLGNSSIATLRCQVTTITSLSDQRDKKDIVDLSSVMPFVNALRPRSFVWNMRDGGKIDIPEIGFIAQELQTAQQDASLTVPNLVNAENPDRLEAGYGALIPILVKAIQELSARVAVLEAQ